MLMINVEKLNHTYQNGKHAIQDLSFTLEKGEVLAIIGPSGAGKSTLLKLIAGLLQVQQGNIYFQDVDVSQQSPSMRRVGMIFQDAALFPDTKVKDNITYGMKKLGYSRSEIKQELAEISQLLHIDHLLNQYPASLSGGEAQRVDIARALIRKPSILLLDEPFSSLDANLKDEMRQLFIKLQQELNMTMIMVTHDQQDAMLMADKIALMKSGRLVALDTPDHLYDHPPNVFAASFLGTPPMNFLDAIVYNEADKSYLFVCGKKMLLPNNYHNCDIICGIRPEKIHVSEDGLFEGYVKWVKRDRGLYLISVVCFETELLILSAQSCDPQDIIRFQFELTDCRFFHKHSDGQYACHVL